MAYLTQISEHAAEHACDAIVDLLDGGTIPVVVVYHGAGEGTPLVTFELDGTEAFTDAAYVGVWPAGAAVATFEDGTPITGSPTDDGTAHHFVVYTQAGGTEIWRGTCGASGGAGFDMELDSTAIAVGTDVTMSTFTFRMPAQTTCPP